MAPAPLWGIVTPVAAPSQEVLQGGGRTPPLPTFVSLTLWGPVFLWNPSCVDGYICWVPPVSPGLGLPCLEVLWGRGVWSLRALLLPEEGIFGPINQRQAALGPAYFGCVNKLHFLGDWPSITLCHTPLIRGGHERSSLRWKKNNIIGPPHACTIPDPWGWQDTPSLCWDPKHTRTHTESLTLNMLVFLCLSKFPSKNGHLEHSLRFFLATFQMNSVPLSVDSLCNSWLHSAGEESGPALGANGINNFLSKPEKLKAQSSPCWFFFPGFLNGFFVCFGGDNLLFLFTILQHYWFWKLLELGKGERMTSRWEFKKLNNEWKNKTFWVKGTVVYKKFLVFKNKSWTDLLYGNTEKSSNEALETELVSAVDWCSSDIKWNKSSLDFWAGLCWCHPLVCFSQKA